MDDEWVLETTDRLPHLRRLLLLSAIPLRSKFLAAAFALPCPPETLRSHPKRSLQLIACVKRWRKVRMERMSREREGN